MKKTFVILTTIILVLSLAACGEVEEGIQTITDYIDDIAGNNFSDKTNEDDYIDEPIDERKEAENSDETSDEQEGTENFDDVSDEQSETEDSDEQADTQEETGNSESTANNDTSSADGIRPEFKEAMDSYEAFFDEYVEFMKKYSNSSDTLSLLTDYMSFMSRYVETMKSLEELGESDMSEAEALYYVEVMARINAKLLEVAY